MDLYNSGKALISPRQEIVWLGFKSNTYTMQGYGWEFKIEMNEYDMEMNIYLFHKRDMLKGVGRVNYDRMMHLRYGRREPEIPPVQVTLASELKISPDAILKSVDMRPEMIDERIQQYTPIDVEYWFNASESMQKLDPKIEKEIALDPAMLKRRLDLFKE